MKDLEDFGTRESLRTVLSTFFYFSVVEFIKYEVLYY